jgi:hypothetical protein
MSQLERFENMIGGSCPNVNWLPTKNETMAERLGALFSNVPPRSAPASTSKGALVAVKD